jgi:hypothetical protein
MKTVIFVDDDAEARRQLLELCSAFRPDLSAKAAESIPEIIHDKADFYVVDISAVTFGLSLSGAYSAICSLMEEHPSATLIITSASSRAAADDIIDDVETHIGRKPIYGGCGPWESLSKALS